jgi:hypothetical protein
LLRTLQNGASSIMLSHCKMTSSMKSLWSSISSRWEAMFVFSIQNFTANWTQLECYGVMENTVSFLIFSCYLELIFLYTARVLYHNRWKISNGENPCSSMPWYGRCLYYLIIFSQDMALYRCISVCVMHVAFDYAIYSQLLTQKRT